MLRYNPSSTVDVTISADYTRERHSNNAEVLIYADNANPNSTTVNGIPLDSRFICGRFCNYATNGQSAGTFFGIAVPPTGQPLTATTGPEQQTFTGWGVSANAEFELSDNATLTSITAYREFDTLFGSDLDLSPAQVNYGINGLTNWFWSQEARLNVEATSWLNLTVGGYYSDEKSVYYSLQDIRVVGVYPPAAPVILPLFPLQFIQDDPVRTRSYAGFATATFTLTDALTLTLGGRYTHDTKSYSFYRYNVDGMTINPYVDPVGSVYGSGYNGADTFNLFGGGTVAALTGRTATYSGNHFDYRASVDYRFSPSVLAYATTSTGYKAGGVGPRPFNAAQARPFGPERLTAYEVGLKTDFFDRRLRVNLAGYYSIFQDAQLTLLACPQYGGPGPCALPQNAGNAHVTGIEAEFSATPVDGLQIDGSISHLHWNWTCVDPAVLGLASGPCSSDPAIVGLLNPRPAGVVADQWSFGVQYEAQMGSSGTVTPRLDVNHQGSMPTAIVAPAPGTPPALLGTVPAYTLANARLTWRNADRDLSVALEVTNIFDNYYYPAVADLTGAGSGAISAVVGRPREWAVTIRKNF
jgi:iron complex outermembrane receptor protein